MIIFVNFILLYALHITGCDKIFLLCFCPLTPHFHFVNISTLRWGQPQWHHHKKEIQLMEANIKTTDATSCGETAEDAGHRLTEQQMQCRDNSLLGVLSEPPPSNQSEKGTCASHTNMKGTFHWIWLNLVDFDHFNIIIFSIRFILFIVQHHHVPNYLFCLMLIIK